MLVKHCPQFYLQYVVKSSRCLNLDKFITATLKMHKPQMQGNCFRITITQGYILILTFYVEYKRYLVWIHNSIEVSLKQEGMNNNQCYNHKVSDCPLPKNLAKNFQKKDPQ